MAESVGRISLLNTDLTERQSFPLLNPRLTIGRLPTCDVRIQLPSVSKLHAEIELSPDDGTGHLDVKSANGVRSESRLYRLGETLPLKDGSIFTIAARTFRIEIACKPPPALIDEAPAPPPRLLQTPAHPNPSLLSASPSARSLLAALVSPFGFGSSVSRPAPQPLTPARDLIEWSDDSSRRLSDRSDSPMLPGGLKEEKELSISSTQAVADDDSSSESSDEEIERSLLSPRTSLGGSPARISPPPQPLPSPNKLPNGVNRRHSLREKVLIRSAVRTHAMQRSYSTGSLQTLGSDRLGALPLRRSSLPIEAPEPPAAAVPDTVIDVPHDATEDHDDQLESGSEEVNVRDYEQDLVDEPEGTSTSDVPNLWSRSPPSSPEETRADRPRSNSASSSSDSEMSPRALRAIRRASLTDPSVTPEPASVETSTPPRAAREDTLSPSPEAEQRHNDREVPLNGEPPITPRRLLKPRKSALKTPPAASPSDPETSTSTLKRKLSVNWDETLERVREIPHRLDIDTEPEPTTMPSAKKARLQPSPAPTADVSAPSLPASDDLTPSASRPTLIFVHEHPELNIPLTPTRTPTSARRVLSTRIVHSAGRARRETPGAASVQRALVAPMTASRMTQTPQRATPLPKPGRSVSPTKKRNDAESDATERPVALAELLKSPIPKLGSFHPAPPSTPQPEMVKPPATPSKTPTAQSLMSRLASIKRSTTRPTAQSGDAGEAPLISFGDATELAPPVANEAATPNLVGIRTLFKETRPPPQTPQFGGVRQLFMMPTIQHFSPQLEGVKELLQPPTPAAKVDGLRPAEKPATLPLVAKRVVSPLPSSAAGRGVAVPAAAAKVASVSALPIRAAMRKPPATTQPAASRVPEPRRALPLHKAASKEKLREEASAGAAAPATTTPAVPKGMTRSDTNSSISSNGSDRELRSQSRPQASAPTVKKTGSGKTPATRHRTKSVDEDISPSTRAPPQAPKAVAKTGNKENSHDANGKAVSKAGGVSKVPEVAGSRAGRALRARKV